MAMMVVRAWFGVEGKVEDWKLLPRAAVVGVRGVAGEWCV